MRSPLDHPSAPPPWFPNVIRCIQICCKPLASIIHQPGFEQLVGYSCISPSLSLAATATAMAKRNMSLKEMLPPLQSHAKLDSGFVGWFLLENAREPPNLALKSVWPTTPLLQPLFPPPHAIGLLRLSENRAPKVV